MIGNGPCPALCEMCAKQRAGADEGMSRVRKAKAGTPARPSHRAVFDDHRISAPEAERLGLYPDWPTWPLGANLTGTWEWLLRQVEAGTFPDLPCRWSDQAEAERAVVYWLDVRARTRHVVTGYGDFVLTQPAVREARNRLH